MGDIRGPYGSRSEGLRGLEGSRSEGLRGLDGPRSEGLRGPEGSRGIIHPWWIIKKNRQRSEKINMIKKWID